MHRLTTLTNEQALAMDPNELKKTIEATLNSGEQLEETEQTRFATLFLLSQAKQLANENTNSLHHFFRYITFNAISISPIREPSLPHPIPTGGKHNIENIKFTYGMSISKKTTGVFTSSTEYIDLIASTDSSLYILQGVLDNRSQTHDSPTLIRQNIRDPQTITEFFKSIEALSTYHNQLSHDIFFGGLKIGTWMLLLTPAPAYLASKLGEKLGCECSFILSTSIIWVPLTFFPCVVLSLSLATTFYTLGACFGLLSLLVESTIGYAMPETNIEAKVSSLSSNTMSFINQIYEDNSRSNLGDWIPETNGSVPKRIEIEVATM